MQSRAWEALMLWGAFIIGIMNIAIVSLHAYHSGDASDWIPVFTITILIICIVVASWRLRKLMRVHENPDKKASAQIQVYVSVIPLMANVAITSAMTMNHFR